LIKEELNVKTIDWIVKKDATDPLVTLDTKIGPQLKEEGMARELIRKIQNERKNQGFGLRQKAKVSAEWIPDDKKMIEKIKKVTISETLSKGKFKVEKA
jgi:isoleucyl-tRNA synthetase